MVMDYKIKMFTLTRGEYTSEEMGEIILKALNKIKNFVKKNDPPYIVSISKSSNLNRLL